MPNDRIKAMDGPGLHEMHQNVAEELISNGYSVMGACLMHLSSMLYSPPAVATNAAGKEACVYTMRARGSTLSIRERWSAGSDRFAVSIQSLTSEAKGRSFGNSGRVTAALGLLSTEAIADTSSVARVRECARLLPASGIE